MKMNWKTNFLEESILGRKTDRDVPDEVIVRCIRIAYRDMLTAGKYYISSDTDSRCDSFKKLLTDCEYSFSRDLIEKTCSIFENEIIGAGNRYVTSYGLAQKLVNMTFKYLYIFEDHIDLTIDFSVCDCPLDSVILGKLPRSEHPWSKITKDEYAKTQGDISAQLKAQSLDEELQKIGNLAYDFLNW